MKPFAIYLIVLAVMSAVAFFAYASDKRKAVRGEWRVPEKTLLALSFFGGAAGGWTAMFVFRHKTRHWYFHAVNFAGLLVQAGLLVFFLCA